MKDYDVVVIGGGLAGLSATIHLGLKSKKVLLLEKGNYPRHKVCGEYLSREILPYLYSLGINLDDGPKINRLRLSNRQGRTIESDLPLGAVGISRLALDHRLYCRAREVGVQVIFDTVTDISFSNETFTVTTVKNRTVTSDIVIGAFGKRSLVDKILKRSFMAQSNPWVAVKSHFQFDRHPEDLVGIHAFKGGYGGISKTESGTVNFCYLAHFDSFKLARNVEAFNREVVAENPFLNELLTHGKPLMSKPLTISQISFQKKEAVENHVLMCGDAAGLIHPLCGNGMAMAIHSAKIVANLVCQYLDEPEFKRADIEKAYRRQWTENFAKRLWWGRKLQYLLLNPGISDTLFYLFSGSHRLTRSVISKTHGKTLEVR